MIPMLIDYFQYKFRIGRFGSNHLPNSFHDSALEQLWPHLREGDMLFVSTPNSFLSWLVMYVTSEPFSHVAIYAGDQKVSHMTTKGYSLDNVSIFQESGSKVIPIVAPIEKKDRKKFLDATSEFVGMPYGWWVTIAKGLRMFLGRDYPRFKLKFSADVILTIFLLDLFTFLLLGNPIIYWLLIPYLAVLLRNIYAFRTGDNDFDFVTGAHIFHEVIKNGGRIIHNYGMIDGYEKDMPSVVTSDMYVFFHIDKFPSKEQLDNRLSFFVGQITDASDYAPIEESFDIECVIKGIKGCFQGKVLPYNKESERLGYGSSSLFTHSLSINSSIDIEDMISSVAFACSFANASEGVFYNPGVHMSVHPNDAIEVGQSILSELHRVHSKREEKANNRVEQTAGKPRLS